MNGILLTQHDGFILGPIAKLLGLIMEGIFWVIDLIGIPNIGLAIILFTIVVNILMMPLTIKQQKFSKLSAIIQPEVQAIQAKYKNRKDQESQMAMSQEVQKVYAKYGVSQTGGCLYLLIQMPILFALYRVIYAIPAYVSKVGDTFRVLANAIISHDGGKGVEVLKSMTDGKIAQTISMYGKGLDATTTKGVENGVIDVLNRLSSTDMATVAEKFNLSELQHNGEVILGDGGLLETYNNFLGLNIVNSPQQIMMEAFAKGAILVGIGALLIPILSVITQWINTKLMPQHNTNNDNGMGSSMKTMNLVMPLISAWFSFSWAAGMGIYWVAGNIVRCIQQVIVNKHMDKISLEELIEQNKEKSAKKLAKLEANQERMNAYANMKTRNIQNRANTTTNVSEAEKEEAMKKATEYYNSGNVKPGSMMAKANMVRQYNEKNNKDNN
ncbi:MAG: YidC/Oxa1 family membrane protein insertase [Lachnospiraceae bacterium]|nr:YidC/Oxa1 family membrane protein insertase [Lachnospiraceae bacterium]